MHSLFYRDKVISLTEDFQEGSAGELMFGGGSSLFVVLVDKKRGGSGPDTHAKAYLAIWLCPIGVTV